MSTWYPEPIKSYLLSVSVFKKWPQTETAPKSYCNEYTEVGKSRFTFILQVSDNTRVNLLHILIIVKLLFPTLVCAIGLTWLWTKFYCASSKLIKVIMMDFFAFNSSNLFSPSLFDKHFRFSAVLFPCYDLFSICVLTLFFQLII